VLRFWSQEVEVGWGLEEIVLVHPITPPKRPTLSPCPLKVITRDICNVGSWTNFQHHPLVPPGTRRKALHKLRSSALDDGKITCKCSMLTTVGNFVTGVWLLGGQSLLRYNAPYHVIVQLQHHTEKLTEFFFLRPGSQALMLHDFAKGTLYTPKCSHFKKEF
jgi:hypothetical protein